VFTWITEALAVGGRFGSEVANALAREHRITAVVDLRDEACDDEVVLRRHGVAFLHLPTPDLHGATLPALCEGVAFVKQFSRVLVHCEHGIGRSALLALCVLVDGGMHPLAALALAKDRRAAVSPSPAQYEAWATWLRHTGHPVPHFDDFAAIAYRHLHAGLR
jgi:protein-tyrosine phosphatase